MSTTVKYMTIVEPVFEVSFVGTAKRSVWQAGLKDDGLLLPQGQDEVQVILSAVETTYMGIRFRELSLSLLLDDTQALMVHAFNSHPAFAFVEQRFFKTPYFYADVTFSERRISVRQKGRPLFEAALPESAVIAASRDECSERKIWLTRSAQTESRHYFFARLEGHADYYQPAGASVQFLDGAALNPSFDLLRQSNFQISGWLVRQRGRHSKSKTFTQG